MKKAILLTAILLISGAVLPQTVFGIGQVTEPIVVENALRGESFQQIMTIVNTEDKEIKVNLFAEGDIVEWVKFYQKDDLENPIENLQMPSREKLKIIAEFAVPSDVPNGEYAGLVSVIRRPDADPDIGENESSTSISQRISRNVTITVSDEEIIQFSVSVIPEKYGFKKSEPLKVRVIYDNQGNTSIAPQAHFKIKKDDKVVYNVIFPYPDEPLVKPLTIYEISTIQIPTNEFEKGKYITEVDFLHNGNSVFKKNFSFAIDEELFTDSSNQSPNIFASIGGGNTTFGYVLVGGFVLAVAVIVIKKRPRRKQRA